MPQCCAGMHHASHFLSDKSAASVRPRVSDRWTDKWTNICSFLCPSVNFVARHFRPEWHFFLFVFWRWGAGAGGKMWTLQLKGHFRPGVGKLLQRVLKSETEGLEQELMDGVLCWPTYWEEKYITDMLKTRALMSIENEQKQSVSSDSRKSDLIRHISIRTHFHSSPRGGSGQWAPDRFLFPVTPG